MLEVLGALGLVLPGLLRLRAALTPLAAGGLVLLMCGAVGATLASPASAARPGMALVPAAVGALAALVVVGRAGGLRPTPLGAAGDRAGPLPWGARPTGGPVRAAGRRSA